MKKVLALMMVMVMALGFTSVVNAEGNAQVFWYTFGDVYLSSVRVALDAALEREGLSFTNNDANATQSTQTDQVSTAVASQADVLIINMVESGASGIAQNLIESAKDIPVVFFNRPLALDNAEAAELIKGHGKSAFVGTNNEEAGMMQGKMIGEYVLANYDAIDLNGDGVISYVMFKGDEANQEAILRTQYGVEDADKVLVEAGKPQLKFYDDANTSKYLVDMNGTWSNSASFEYMSTILGQYNEANNNMIELVIANNDDMALGAVNALTNAGYNSGEAGAKVIPVFGVDATDAAKDLIATGRMTGTIKQDAEGMADAVAVIAANLVAGRPTFENLNPSYTLVDDWMVAIPYSVYTGE